MSNKYRRRIARKARYHLRSYNPFLAWLKGLVVQSESLVDTIRDCLAEWADGLRDAASVLRERALLASTDHPQEPTE